MADYPKPYWNSRDTLIINSDKHGFYKLFYDPWRQRELVELEHDNPRPFKIVKTMFHGQRTELQFMKQVIARMQQEEITVEEMSTVLNSQPLIEAISY